MTFYFDQIKPKLLFRKTWKTYFVRFWIFSLNQRLFITQNRFKFSIVFILNYNPKAKALHKKVEKQEETKIQTQIIYEKSIADIKNVIRNLLLDRTQYSCCDVDIYFTSHVSRDIFTFNEWVKSHKTSNTIKCSNSYKAVKALELFLFIFCFLLCA